MRDGLPEAKSCRAELAELQKQLALQMAVRTRHARELTEARERYDRTDDDCRSISDQIASLADGIISNLEYEINEQLPSMWKQPVKIEVAA